VYGGVSIPAANALVLTNAVDVTRQKFSIPRTTLLKFLPVPEGLTHQEYIEVKQEIIKAAVDNDCKFFTSLILHNVANENARLNEINRISYHYNCYLSRKNSHGLVLIDRFSDKQIDQHLRNKFALGLVGMPFSETMRLKNIVGFHFSAIGQSDMATVIDIVLGSFRFSINAFTRNDDRSLPTARKLLELISPLFVRNDSSGCISRLSLFFSPMDVRWPAHRQRYANLSSFLSDCGIPPFQYRRK